VPFSRWEHSGGGDPAEIATFFAAVAQGAEAEYIAAYPSDLSPTTDDRPFFFDPQRKDRLFSAPLYHYKELAWFLIVVTALAGLAIAAPIPVFLRQRDRQGGLFRTLAYFLSLGLGFMILEIGFIQKLVLFLGHQTYAITVVLATLLVSAGLGSAASGRFTGPGSRSVRLRAVPAILLAAFLLFLALDYLAPLAAPLPLGARILLAFLALFPLGFALGIPFPTGLAALSSQAPGLVPWAVAANGFASVVGAAVALPAAMIFGYRSLLIAGGALYLLAAISFPSRSSSE
jgi:hypothetical protein